MFQPVRAVRIALFVLATAGLFAGNGWNVVVNYSRDAAPTALAADERREFGAEVIVGRGLVI